MPTICNIYIEELKGVMIWLCGLADLDMAFQFLKEI
jgi:hypothetical protein